MIPLRDTVKSKTIPFVNWLLIGTCGVVFLYEAGLGDRLVEFIEKYAVVPSGVWSVITDRRWSFRPLYPLVTSIFVHGGWMHLIGNMLFLYIFGDNVEDRLGHFGYGIFFILAGIGAALVQVYSNPYSAVPLIGASGAIAGVLGAYFLLYPKAKILTLIPLFVFFPVVEISAFFFLGFWLLLQFFEGWVAGGADGTGGGVAWWAHAGGFVVGAALLPVFLVVRRIAK